MGRPVLFDEKMARQLKSICRLRPTLSDCSAFLEVSEDTIERWIRKTHDITFAEFRDKNMVHTKFRIITKILEKADEGDNTMLIWSSKNICGWSDKVDSDVTSGGQPIQIKIDGTDKNL